jgi:hypothetical protein
VGHLPKRKTDPERKTDRIAILSRGKLVTDHCLLPSLAASWHSCVTLGTDEAHTGSGKRTGLPFVPQQRSLSKLSKNSLKKGEADGRCKCCILQSCRHRPWVIPADGFGGSILRVEQSSLVAGIQSGIEALKRLAEAIGLALGATYVVYRNPQASTST